MTDDPARVRQRQASFFDPTRCALDHSAISFAPAFCQGRRGPMRAYLTVAGMALGLVALWAALVPLLA